MQISLSDIGKRFNRDWIFRNFSYQFTPEHSYAITGPNGSGKSTLLQVIAGAIMSSEGKIDYKTLSPAGYNSIDPEHAYKNVSIAAPYQEVIEEMTLTEFFHFHQQFKPLLAAASIDEIITIIGLQKSAGKQIRYYSSGMKQRVKLAQAFFSDTPCVLLDEPCTNLDEDGIALYQRLVAAYGRDRLVIVSSNDKQEYGFCDEVVDIMQYK
ncbi:MAG: ATP-binding cassette domain-containing protein [Flavitalea sp.]